VKSKSNVIFLFGGIGFVWVSPLAIFSCAPSKVTLTKPFDWLEP